MQAKNLKGGQELLCINTEKVYDWIINEATFDLTLDDVDLPVVNGVQLLCDDIDSVTCEVEPGDSEILNRVDREFVINGTQITLQTVTIQKTFEVTVFVVTTTGQTVEAGTFPFTRCEQVVLCAPEGTTVTVDYTDVDCFVCLFNCEDVTPGAVMELGITVRLCQSIQSTFPVTLELVADFCQPRDILDFIPVCPTPAMPPQCPVLFPNNSDDDL
ncbi:hypothetical protein [Halalkalibacter alkalisediminis]|uniref:DUF3794 domain-containing protein n=1 Tax=Halalkalibacter alkalisediminis TaxID=935616 RepID=A0ABV6NMK0_9BACI|nr:hypothetical protein [Halalkalibacter alkalisediminis]